MNDIAKLEALGLTDTQIATILSGWSNESIESLLRGQADGRHRVGYTAEIDTDPQEHSS